MDGDLLTDDEKAARHPRWAGQVQDLPSAIKNMAKVHGVASEEAIEESENWQEFIDELCMVINQLSQGGTV